MIEQGVQGFVVRGDNSVKAIPLSGWTPSEMTGLAPSTAGPHEVYRRVPAVYRCVSARAHAVSRVPFDVKRAGRATLKADRDEVTRWIKRHLYQIEASLCLDGGAYLMPERNKVKLLGLRWLRFDTVTPLLDSQAGLAGFERSIGAGEPLKCTPDDIVHIWLPDPDVEIGPGVAPTEVALKPALTILRASEYVESFFERGGMNVTLLIVDPSTGTDDMKRLETWWKRLTRGVKKAWEAIAFKKNVEVKQFGYAPEQMAMPELRAGALREIANAFGVPEFYLSSDVANYATAENYSLTFNEDVIQAELELIETALNDQLLAQVGLKMTFHAERLEVFQKSELAKAQGITELVGAPILSVNEGREMLELDPVPGGDWDEAEAEPVASPAPPVVPDIPAQQGPPMETMPPVDMAA
jgi:HK97 family phage portal protein